jgi:hypothetical protein
MVALVEDCVKNFIHFHPVICEWRSRLSVLMMNGDVAGQKSCNIASPLLAHWMVMHWEIYFSPRSGIEMEIQFKDLIELVRFSKLWEEFYPWRLSHLI